MVVMRTVQGCLNQDGEGKFRAAFTDHANDPAGLIPGDFLFHVVFIWFWQARSRELFSHSSVSYPA